MTHPQRAPLCSFGARPLGVRARLSAIAFCHRPLAEGSVLVLDVNYYLDLMLWYGVWRNPCDADIVDVAEPHVDVLGDVVV